MNFNSELQQIYSLVRDSIKHTNFFYQQKMNFGKFIFLINNIKMSQFFLFDRHQIIIIWWTSKHFKNSEMLQNFSIPKVKTIWELSQFDSSHRSRMFYFPNNIIWNFKLPQRLSALWVYFLNIQRTFTISKYLFRNVF